MKLVSVLILCSGAMASMYVDVGVSPRYLARLQGSVLASSKTRAISEKLSEYAQAAGHLEEYVDLFPKYFVAETDLSELDLEIAGAPESLRESMSQLFNLLLVEHLVYKRENVKQMKYVREIVGIFMAAGAVPESVVGILNNHMGLMHAALGENRHPQFSSAWDDLVKVLLSEVKQMVVMKAKTG